MPDIDLDAIEALTSDPYQYAQVSPEVTRGYLTALLAELRATTADLAVAVEVARERGEEVERLRAVAKAALESREAERGTHYAEYDLSQTIAALDRAREAERNLDAALDAWRAGGGA